MNRTAAYYQNYFDANFFEYEMMDDDDGYWHFFIQFNFNPELYIINSL